MSHAFAISMTKPHEALGLPQPIGRRLPHGIAGWNIAIAATTVAMMCFYVVSINASATRAYNLRNSQRRVDGLKTNVAVLQSTFVSESSLRSLSDRASQLGLVPVDNLEFINPTGGSYALAN